MTTCDGRPRGGARLRDDPDYPTMLEALRARALRDLGPDAVVTELEAAASSPSPARAGSSTRWRRLADDLVDDGDGCARRSHGRHDRPRSTTTRPAGRVVRVSGPLVEVEGLDDVAMSDMVQLGPRRLPGELVALSDGVATVQAYEYSGGLTPGDPVRPVGEPLSAWLGPGLLGGMFDGLLRPLLGAETWLRPGGPVTPDARSGSSSRTPLWATTGARATLGVVHTDGPLVLRVLVPPRAGGRVDWVAEPGRPSGRRHPGRGRRGRGADGAALAGAPGPPHRGRIDTGEPLVTGQRVLDLLYPIALGSTAGVPGGFGTGKTVLLQQVAKWCTADVIVYVGCGERGNEMADVVAELADLVDPRTGGRLAQRTVVIANTSNMPMMAREASVYTGMTVAEYFRDMGLHAVVIADSTSRWAEALREFASRSGALPAEEGYPASLASSLAAFYERAGQVDTLGGLRGSVTVIGAVSPRAAMSPSRSVRTRSGSCAASGRWTATSPTPGTTRRCPGARRSPGTRPGSGPGTQPAATRNGPVAGAGCCPWWRRLTGSPPWPTWSASDRCPVPSVWCCSPVGCCVRRSCSRAPCRPTTPCAPRPRPRPWWTRSWRSTTAAWPCSAPGPWPP